jgi:cytochrome c biogenesis protein CcdA
MDFTLSTYGLGYLAGVLSTLSPCVLPLIPILIGSAVTAHRLGPYALAAGLSLSFTAIGLLLAVAGFALGLDAGVLRQGAGVLLIALAVVLLSPPLQRWFATLTSGAGAQGDRLLGRYRLDGLAGQFLIGLVLGLVWSPCVGPTLGAAATLAAQGRQLPNVGLLMLLFGIGAGTPLFVLGSLSRPMINRLRGRLMVAGQHGKIALGCIMLLLGVATVTGGDKVFEAWAVDHSPAWLTDLSTRY